MTEIQIRGNGWNKVSTVVKESNPVEIKNGRASWIELPGDKYVLTGVDRKRRRFRITTENWRYASGINLWRGNLWLLRNGKKWKIQSVSN